MTFIAAVEIRHVQRYIFATNRLLDVVGRSATLAEFARHDGPLLASLLTVNGRVPLGGGAANLYVRCASREDAQTLLADVTRAVRDRASSAGLVTAIVDDPDGAATPADVATALLKNRRSHTAAHLPAPSFGITSICTVSGLPADAVTSAREARGREVLNSEVVGARTRGRTWHRNQQDALLADAPSPAGVSWRLPLELGHIADTKGDFSRLAVLHLDVNRLGLTLRDHFASAANPFDAAGDVGTAVASVLNALARHLLHHVAAAAGVTDDGTITITGFPRDLNFPVVTTRRAGQSTSTEAYLPVRPIVTAGDELTLVCDARLALDLTAAAMRWWDTSTGTLPSDDPRRVLVECGSTFEHLEDPERLGLTFSVGISVFPGGSPLTVAYERAAALTEAAKEFRTEGHHAVAWSTRQRDPASTVDDLCAARDASATVQPYSADDLAFLIRYLGAEGLRKDGTARNKLKASPRMSELLQTRTPGAAPSAEVYEHALHDDALQVLDLVLDTTPPPDEKADCTEGRTP